MDTHAGRSEDSHSWSSRHTWGLAAPRSRASTGAPPAPVVARPSHRCLVFLEKSDFGERQATEHNGTFWASTRSENEHFGRSGKATGQRREEPHYGRMNESSRSSASPTDARFHGLRPTTDRVPQGSRAPPTPNALVDLAVTGSRRLQGGQVGRSCAVACRCGAH